MASHTLHDFAPLRRGWPFWAMGALAIVVAGGLSGALAHAASRQAMWLVAYLVLVVGVAQLALAAGQFWLASFPPSRSLLVAEWAIFNAAHALVIAGALSVRPAWVTAGTLTLVVALGLFLRGVHGGTGGRWLYAYRTLVVFLGASALVGVLLTFLRPRG